MKKLYLICWSLLCLSHLYSQQSGCNCPVDEDYEKQLRIALIGTEYHDPLAGYEGTQYSSFWTQGEVILNNGDVIKNIHLRYDKYLDEILWLRNSGFKAGILKKGAISGFQLYDDRNKIAATFMKKRILLPFVDSTDTYLQVLVSGAINLYAYRNTTVVWRESKLLDNNKYLLGAGGELYWLELKRKSLLGIPVLQRTKMKSLLRSNRIMIRNDESEMARAISLYNAAKDN